MRAPGRRRPRRVRMERERARGFQHPLSRGQRGRGADRCATRCTTTAASLCRASRSITASCGRPGRRARCSITAYGRGRRHRRTAPGGEAEPSVVPWLLRRCGRRNVFAAPCRAGGVRRPHVDDVRRGRKIGAHALQELRNGRRSIAREVDHEVFDDVRGDPVEDPYARVDQWIDLGERVRRRRPGRRIARPDGMARRRRWPPGSDPASPAGPAPRFARARQVASVRCRCAARPWWRRGCAGRPSARIRCPAPRGGREPAIRWSAR